jgi:hypothetical protein
MVNGMSKYALLTALPRPPKLPQEAFGALAWATGLS